MKPSVALGQQGIVFSLGSSEPVELDVFDALLLGDQISQCAAIIREQRRQEPIGPLPEGLVEELAKRKPDLSTGFNVPRWVGSGEHFLQEWRDDQGRRVRSYVATFHEAAGVDGWMEKVLGAVVEALNQAGVHMDLPAYREALKGDSHE